MYKWHNIKMMILNVVLCFGLIAISYWGLHNDMSFYAVIFCFLFGLGAGISLLANIVSLLASGNDEPIANPLYDLIIGFLEGAASSKSGEVSLSMKERLKLENTVKAINEINRRENRNK